MKILILTISLIFAITNARAQGFNITPKSKEIRFEISQLIETWDKQSLLFQTKGVRPFAEELASDKLEGLNDKDIEIILKEKIKEKLKSWVLLIKNYAREVCGEDGQQIKCKIKYDFNYFDGENYSQVKPVFEKDGQKLNIAELSFPIRDIQLSSSKKVMESPLIKYTDNDRTSYKCITEYSYMRPEIRAELSGKEFCLQEKTIFTISSPEEEENNQNCTACLIKDSENNEAPSGEFYSLESEDRECSPYIQIHQDDSCSLIEMRRGKCRNLDISQTENNLSMQIMDIISTFEVSIQVPIELN